MTTMSSRRKQPSTRSLSLCAAAGLVLAGTAFAAPANAATHTLTRGTCTGGGTVTLELQHSDPGVLEAGFEVDHAKRGSVWRVRLVHNGVAYFSDRRTATGGTFSIDGVLTDRSGTDTISGRARNLATGQVCTVTGRI